MENLADTYEYQQGKQTLNFKKVADPENWKLPTEYLAVDTAEEADAIREAVIHFTGSVPDIQFKDHANRYLIYPATGYYAEIGA